MAVFWGAVYAILLLIGLVKTMSGDSQVEFTKFVSKNIIQATCIGVYINLQDMALIISHVYFQLTTTFSFSNIYFII